MTPPLYIQVEQGAAAGTREARYTPPVRRDTQAQSVSVRERASALPVRRDTQAQSVSVRERLPKRRRNRSRTVKLRQKHAKASLRPVCVLPGP